MEGQAISSGDGQVLLAGLLTWGVAAYPDISMCAALSCVPKSP